MLSRRGDGNGEMTVRYGKDDWWTLVGRWENGRVTNGNGAVMER